MTAQGLQRNEVTEATQRQQQSNLNTNSIVCQHSLLERIDLFDRGALLFVYQRADGLAGIFIPVVNTFCRTLPNDGGVGTGIPHTTHTGEIPRETTQLPR